MTPAQAAGRSAQALTLAEELHLRPQIVDALCGIADRWLAMAAALAEYPQMQDAGAGDGESRVFLDGP